MPPKSGKVAILIPAYNAEKTIGEVVKRCAEYVPVTDVVVVNDGSADGTGAKARASGAVVLMHPANRGKGEALKTAFAYAIEKKYTGVVTLDADLQHYPQYVPNFVQTAQRARADVLVGSRPRTFRNMPFSRVVTNTLTSILISITSGQVVRDSQSGYRYFTTEALKKLRPQSSRYDLESEMLIQAGRCGLRIAAVPISTVYEGSRSFINPFKDTGRFIRILWRSLWW